MMCGILGFNWKDAELARRMAGAIAHRGPDARGFYTDPHVSLGHLRLSILDLSEKGSQPMAYKDFHIVFNGEIYNFTSIRHELLEMGHTFISDTDTEVILHAYDQWGPDCAERFNGMWAFCIYDKKKNILWLSRDRFGIKPLHYYFDGTKFIFASELKAIRQHVSLEVDMDALNFYFYQRYVGQAHSIYRDCHKVMPSENLFFDIENKSISRNRYYDIEKEIEKARNTPLDKRLADIRKYVKDAVLSRLIADVPVGSFLSGGLDSSLVSAIIAKNKKDFDTFSIGFKQQSYDELEFSKQVAKHIKTDHHYEFLDVNDDLIRQVVSSLDEPHGDPSIFPMYLLSQMTRQNVTVSLSGDAGDEVFGGYDSYMGFKLYNYFPNVLVPALDRLVGLIPPSSKKFNLRFKAKKFLQTSEPNASRRHMIWMSTYGEDQRKKLLREYVPAEELIDFRGDSLTDIQLTDMEHYLVGNNLAKVDITSMLHALEVRVPYLDHRLVPLVLSLPDEYKLRWLQTKHYLKKIGEQYLPKEIVYRKKRGFTAPRSHFIKNSRFIQKSILDKRSYEHGLIDRDYVRDMYRSYKRNTKDVERHLWLVFMFNFWWQSTS